MPRSGKRPDPANRMLIDLHLHSTASDGCHAPGEVIAMAAERGFSLIALTDHDSLDGLPEAMEAAAQSTVALLPGVELSTEGQREVHLLGYGLDPVSPSWEEFLMALQVQRRARAAEIVSILDKLGFPLDGQAIQQASAYSVTRAHIAQALVNTGAVTSVKEAFLRFLNPGRPAYVPRPMLPMQEAIEKLRAEGAVPVVAHPGRMAVHEDVVVERIRRWHEAGLMGIEAYHSHHTPTQARRFDCLARSLGMLVTGGSDFHGEGRHNVQIGSGLSAWRTRNQDAEALWHAAVCTCGTFPPHV